MRRCLQLIHVSNNAERLVFESRRKTITCQRIENASSSYVEVVILMLLGGYCHKKEEPHWLFDLKTSSRLLASQVTYFHKDYMEC